MDLCISRPGVDHGVLRAVDLKPGITEVEYEPSTEGSFVLKDGAQVLEGVTVDLYDAGTGLLWLGALSTDTQGRATDRRMVPGPIALLVEQPGVWPVRHVVEVTAPPRVQELQVRRRGSVTLRFTHGGLAVTSLAVRAASQEFQRDVADWLKPGLAAATPSNLRTDSEGRLRLDGLPNGDYSWSVETGDD